MKRYWIKLMDKHGKVIKQFSYKNFQYNVPLQREVYRLKHKEGAVIFCSCQGPSPDQLIALSVGKRKNTYYFINGEGNGYRHRRDCPLHANYVRDFVQKLREKEIKNWTNRP